MTIIKRWLPVTWQLSLLVSLPVFVITQPTQMLLPVIGLALLYHWIAFALTAHMIISHGRTSWINHGLLYGIFFYASYNTPVIWAGLHIAHHKHTDTLKDPQSPGHKSFRVLFATYDETLADSRTMVKHLRNNPISEFFWNHYVKLAVLPVLVTVWIPDIMLWAYWVPASMSLWIATLSAWYTHVNFEPRSDFAPWAKLLFVGETSDHVRHHTDWSYCMSMTELWLTSD